MQLITFNLMQSDLKFSTFRHNDPIANHKYEEVSSWKPISSQWEPAVASKI